MKTRLKGRKWRSDESSECKKLSKKSKSTGCGLRTRSSLKDFLTSSFLFKELHLRGGGGDVRDMTKSTVAYESQIMTALKLIPPRSCFPCPPSELADRQWRGGGGGGDGGQDGGDGGRRAVWDQDAGDLEIITSVYFLINAIPFIFISVFFGHSTQCQSSFRIPDRCSTMKYLPLLVSPEVE